MPVSASPIPEFDAGRGGADPWGVRRAETLLTSLDGVLSARVVTTPLGEVSEIHILAQAGLAPKQVVRNIESALLAHLGLRVDHRKISIAQTADVKPIDALEQQAVRDRALTRGVLFEDLVMTTPRSRHAQAVVTLACDGRVERGSAEGPDTPRNRLETAARATLAVLELLTERHSMALEGAQVLEAFNRSYVLVGVQTIGGRETRLLTGICEVRDSAEQAAVYAVLDATNRWFNWVVAGRAR